MLCIIVNGVLMYLASLQAPQTEDKRVSLPGFVLVSLNGTHHPPHLGAEIAALKESNQGSILLAVNCPSHPLGLEVWAETRYQSVVQQWGNTYTPLSQRVIQVSDSS